MLLLSFSWFHHDAIYAQYSTIIIRDDDVISYGSSSSSSSATNLVLSKENQTFSPTTSKSNSSSYNTTSSLTMIRSNTDNSNNQNVSLLKSSSNTTNSNGNSSSSDVNKVVVRRKIPHRFIFTYKSNIIESKSPPEYYANVMNTIQLYQQAWNEEDGNNQTYPADVWFLNDTDCMQVIANVEPRLSRHFRMEGRGDFKADICRVAALYDRGGYYFDVDMQALQALREGADTIAPNVRFASAYCPQGDYFFQSFLASEAHSPLIHKTIQIILAYYDEKKQIERDFLSSRAMKLTSLVSMQQVISKHEAILGMPVGGINVTTPSLNAYKVFKLLEKRNVVVHLGNNTDLVGVGSLRTAYQQVVLQDGIVDKNDTFLLEESLLTPEVYPNLPRQAAHKGPFCNYIVHHPPTQQVYFFSRFDNTPKCH
jgi:Glycosyltransferase sugar-binding region containing DXD motif